MILKWYAIMQIISILDAFARYLQKFFYLFFIFDFPVSQLSNTKIFSEDYDPSEYW